MEKNNIFYEHHLMHAGLAVYGSKFKMFIYNCRCGGDGGDFSILNLGNLMERISKLYLNARKWILASFHGWIVAMGMSGGENGKVSGLAAYGKVNNSEKNFMTFCLSPI